MSQQSKQREGKAPSTPLPIGAVIPPWGKIKMIGWLDGERYYWLVDKHDSVSMIPASALEKVVGESCD